MNEHAGNLLAVCGEMIMAELFVELDVLSGWDCELLHCVCSFLKEHGGDLRIASGRGMRMGDVLIADYSMKIDGATKEMLDFLSGKSIKIDCSDEDSFYPGMISSQVFATSLDELTHGNMYAVRCSLLLGSNFIFES